MSAAQLALPTRLPLDPTALADLTPLQRGKTYNEFDLDGQQRGCVEEALRLLAADAYPACGEVAAEHLVREREQREALGWSARSGRGQ